MSRVFSPVSLIFHGFPRVSGDEPALALDEEYTVSFSPRERG